MAFSLYPAAFSEYNPQTAGPCFNVRSANSPLYSLSHRSSVRRTERLEDAGETQSHVTNREQTKSTNFRDSTGTHGSVRGQSEDVSGRKSTAQYIQNVRKETPESAVSLRRSTAFKDRGRTEWKSGTLSSRSKSVDCNTEQRSPETNRGLSPIRSGRDISKHASHLLNNRIERGMVGRTAYMSHTLDRPSSVYSLPLRLKAQPGTSSKLSESANTFGPQGGKSILERIEKLYGSNGSGKGEGFSVPETSSDFHSAPGQRVCGNSAGGTFPRRFSTGDNSSLRSSMPLIWTKKDRNSSGSETSLFPRPSMTRERLPVPQWQGQTWGRYSDGDSVTWREGFIESGTKSLDRARSKNTLAAQIRAARASGGMTTTQKPVDLSSGFYKDSFRFADRRASEAKIEITRSTEEKKSEDYEKNEMFKDRFGRFKTEEKEETERERDRVELRNSDENVFDINSHKIQRATERTTFPEKTLSASVRNKISQFEALTQRAHGQETNQATIPRRTLSVPTQLTRGYDEVRTRESTKGGGGLRKWEEIKNEEKSSDKEKMMRAGRSFSVDDVGLTLENKGTRRSNYCDDGNNRNSENPNKHIRPKSVLEEPVNDKAQRGRQQFFIDETDFYKVSSPDEVHLRNLTANDASSLSPSEVTSPLSDDEKTPTNTPDNLPFTPLSAKPAQDTPKAKRENKHTFVFTTPDTLPLTQQPAVSSVSSLPELLSPAAKTTYTKGKKQLLDLEAWVTGLNPDYRSWSYSEDDFEDDDESTQKDEDSSCDSDSGESSITVTSSMSHSDRKSFSVSFTDLCSFTETEADTEDDHDEWPSSSRRSISICSDISTLSSVSMIPSEELDRLLEDVKSLGDNSLQDSNDIMVVVLHKEVGVGLGFSIAGGVDQNKPITVHKVFHLGVAAQEGSIKAGDQVLSINGTALQGNAHWEAHRVLRRAKAREMGVVVLRREDVPSLFKRERKEKNEGSKQMQSDTGQYVKVQLQKNSRHLGFSLEGGEDSSGGNQPLRVQKIFMGGPTNKVFSGDEIVEIQGVSMIGKRRLEAWTLIRTLPPGPVEVVLCRSPKRLKT